MFIHELKYEFLRVLRQKDETFWVLLFPLVLGIFFTAAFSNINNTTENFHAIPVAVCLEEGAQADAFRSVMDVLGEEGEQQFLAVSYTDTDTAQRLLKENRIRGIFTADDDVSLTCAPPDSSNVNSTAAIEQNILEAFLKEYRASRTALMKITERNPSKIPKLLPMLLENASYKKELRLTDGNLDVFVQYFFNLIAMACMYASFAGSQIAIKNQANLSDIGARKCLSPCHKLLSVTAEFLSCFLAQFFCIAANIVFYVYILKIDFGTSLPLLLFTASVGCMMGVSFGFFIGCINRWSANVKISFLIIITMICCFFSGLMVQNMHAVIEERCPVLNRINPAALLADCFHTLNIYDVCQRYFNRIFTLLFISAIFIIGGFLILRRKTYANLSGIF